MLGSLMTLASGVFTSSPSIGQVIGDALILGQRSGKVAMMRPASEMSFVPTADARRAAKLWMIGRSEAEASSGASSTLV
jgi:hypothetical protein